MLYKAPDIDKTNLIALLIYGNRSKLKIPETDDVAGAFLSLLQLHWGIRKF